MPLLPPLLQWLVQLMLLLELLVSVILGVIGQTALALCSRKHFNFALVC
ncbi:hypothetical protein SAMN05660284_00472 [Formivibrio citricus]|uniref:Uncharacterized protein n=1 Tax=Formivibrio citricus TaxID=83765 RepID=A0A1I4W0K5_9NEIS|nr:hypothetical protein SAMN05660284_00472 [Formivibrio citricus]